MRTGAVAMRRRSRVCTAFVATGVAAGGMMACFAAGWNMRLQQATVVEPVLSATEVVALRFPDGLEEAQPAPPADDAATSLMDDTLALFSPYPTYATAAPSDAQDTPSAASPEPAAPEAPPLSAPVPPSSMASKLAAAPVHRNTRPGAVLSDGQIASIKRRLKLTAEQEQMWPAVEVALRSLTYPRKSDGTHKIGSSDGSRSGTVDSNSPEVQQLTSAAYPLVMSFSDDQKRELHVIAHVAGLEQLVPKF
jgi:hypothetical protein